MAAASTDAYHAAGCSSIFRHGTLAGIWAHTCDAAAATITTAAAALLRTKHHHVRHLQSLRPYLDLQRGPIWRRREHFNAVLVQQAGLFDFGAGNRRIPCDRLRGANCIGRVRMRHPFARAVRDDTALMMGALLAGESGFGIGRRGRMEQIRPDCARHRSRSTERQKRPRHIECDVRAHRRGEWSRCGSGQRSSRGARRKRQSTTGASTARSSVPGADRRRCGHRRPPARPPAACPRRTARLRLRARHRLQRFPGSRSAPRARLRSQRRDRALDSGAPRCRPGSTAGAKDLPPDGAPRVEYASLPSASLPAASAAMRKTRVESRRSSIQGKSNTAKSRSSSASFAMRRLSMVFART